MNPQPNNISQSFADIITWQNKLLYHSDHKVLFKANQKHQSFYISPTHTQSQEEPSLHPFNNFQSKLISFLQANQSHAKAATKYFQNISLKQTSKWLRNKKRKEPIFTQNQTQANQCSDKGKKKKSMKQYMAELSLSRRKKYEHKSVSIDVTPTNQQEQSKSHSVLIVKKVHKKRQFLQQYEDDQKGLQQIGVKMPIHHTQTYFFQRKKLKESKCTEQSPEQHHLQPLNSSEIVHQIEQGFFNLQKSDIRKYHPLYNTSASNNQEELQSFDLVEQEPDKLNFIKRRKRMRSKIGKNINKVNNKIKTEQEEGDIGPWQRRKTFDSQVMI